MKYYVLYIFHIIITRASAWQHIKFYAPTNISNMYAQKITFTKRAYRRINKYKSAIRAKLSSRLNNFYEANQGQYITTKSKQICNKLMSLFLF